MKWLLQVDLLNAINIVGSIIFIDAQIIYKTISDPIVHSLIIIIIVSHEWVFSLICAKINVQIYIF